MNTLTAPESLHTWVLSTLPQALAFARSILRNPEAAEDVVHDCYCRLLQKADVYDLPRDGMKILLRSITNACIDHKGRKRPLLSLEAVAEQDNESKADVVTQHAEEPLQQAMARELEQAMEEGLAQLPLAQRAALHMKSSGYSQREIAETLSINANHVGVLIHRARQTMAQYLAPYLEAKER